MNPALWPRDRSVPSKPMWVDPRTRSFESLRLGDLASILDPGDLLVVNDSATLPASLTGRTARGEEIEVRFASVSRGDTWDAVLFGAGNWRTRTEDRPLPPRMAPGDPIVFSGGLHGAIESVSPEWPRFVSIRFPLADCELWRSLYRAAQPVQYAHLAGPLQVWHQQTAYAARPWSVEPPSAGLSLSWHLLDELTRHGVELAFLTHGAGLSSTGDPAIDAALPFPERFDIPASTVEAVVHARKQGTRVVAVGTTVVRALEGCAAANQGALKPGEGTTGLAITGTFVPRIVSGILTGIHETGSSHHRLLEAFAPAPLLRAASARAEETAYLSHEFGDAMLVLPASSLRHGKA